MDYKSYSSLTRTQVGGDHYSKLKIQPIDYILANGFNYHEGAVLKYLTRHKDKGKKQDLEKAIHYLQMMIQSYEQLYPTEARKEESTGCPVCDEAPVFDLNKWRMGERE